ncbi:884_t:CDS:2 [Funneliformis geosporum]|nr:884_t:CDS:2 [Funneliformis geosporum]
MTKKLSLNEIRSFVSNLPKPHAGRPKLCFQKRSHLGKLPSTRKYATSKEIAFTLNLASRTIRKNLFNLGYRVCIPTSIPMLTIAAKERKVEWSNLI